MEFIDCNIINLDSRQDRLESFIKNHTEMGWNEVEFKRTPAILDENFGGIGCAKSHLMTLALFIAKSNLNYCLILEDDFRFRVGYLEFMEIFNEILSIDNKFDVFLLAGTRTLSTKLNNRVVKVFESQSTAGYLVSRNYAQNLIEIFLKSINMMENYRSLDSRDIVYDRFSIDQTWKRLQQQDRWYATNPMIGFQENSYSDIEKRIVDYSNISS